MRSQGMLLFCPPTYTQCLLSSCRRGIKMAKTISPTDFSPGLHLPVFSAVAIPNSRREPFRQSHAKILHNEPLEVDGECWNGRSHKRPALGLAISNWQKISQCCHPEYTQLRLPYLRWGNRLVIPPGTPWTMELLLGEIISDVWQIPDSLYSPSGPQVAQDTSSSLVLLNIVSSERSHCFLQLITAAKCQQPDRFTRTQYCHSPPLSVS